MASFHVHFYSMLHHYSGNRPSSDRFIRVYDLSECTIFLCYFSFLCDFIWTARTNSGTVAILIKDMLVRFCQVTASDIDEKHKNESKFHTKLLLIRGSIGQTNMWPSFVWLGVSSGFLLSPLVPDSCWTYNISRSSTLNTQIEPL
jgi:hypothetical protein